MSESLNPQAAQMADESMVRTLAAQALAIWPQEEPIFRRHGLTEGARVLDAGCGTGEISSRLATLFPTANVVGVDILEGPLAIARARHAALAPRLSFKQASIFELPFADGAHALTVCRHVLQSIPHSARALAELSRVTAKGGRLHLIAEDYGMIHFPDAPGGPRDFFPRGPRAFGAATGTDMFIGRHIHGMLRAAGLSEIQIEYAVVDTLRVPREIFADIWTAWRDGYVDPIAEHTEYSADAARAAFDDMIATLRDPSQYAVWMVPIVSARV
jgi:ubiquinone/menaquinone biosynthesis C-methylase UbiE